MKFVNYLVVLASFTASLSFAFEPLPRKVPAPKDNPITPAKVELGKQLYFDARISIDGTISCQSCHNVMGSGEDNRPNSVGVGGKKGGRSAPTVWNSAFQSVMFWDGRAPSLEEQAKGPMINPVEMAMGTHEVVIERIRNIPGYAKQFKAIFGGSEPVTIDNVAKAIASYERTLVTPNSPFDKFMRGDKKALSAQAIKGMKLFEENGCIACHSGVNFSGAGLAPGEGRYLKFPFIPGSEYDKKYNLMEDLGRYEVTKDETDKNTWRVPTLRNVALTAPYFHNGSVATLDEAVRVMIRTQLNKDLPESDVQAMVAFLESLTGEIPKQTLPILPQTPGKSMVLAVPAKD